MKLNILNKQEFDAWKQKAVRYIPSPYDGTIAWLDIQALQQNPPEENLFTPREISVEPSITIEDLVREITGFSSGEIDGRGTEIRRNLSCPSVEHMYLDPKKTVTDYGIQDDDLLLLSETEIHRVFTGASHIITMSSKDVTDFCRFVRTDAAGLLFEPATIPREWPLHLTPRSPPRPVQASLLYTDEDWELAEYIRYNFASLHQMTGHHLNIYTIEQPAKVNAVSGRTFWKSVLEVNAYRFLNFLGWTRYQPYDKSDAYRIAAALGVYPDALPCVIMYANAEIDRQAVVTDAKVVVTVSGELKSFFRQLSTRVLATIEDLHQRDVNFYDNFSEFKNLFLDKWKADAPVTDSDSRPLVFNGDTVFINKPSGDVTVKDFQKGNQP